MIRGVGLIEQAGVKLNMVASEKDFGWLAGIIDGEGCFHSQRVRAVEGGWYSYCPRFFLTSRYDDLTIPQRVLSIIGVGSLHIKDGYDNACPTVNYSLSGSDQIVEKAIPVFDKCSFVGRKQFEYPLWREMAILVSSWRHRRSYEVNSRLEEIHYDLKGIKTQAFPGPLTDRNRAVLENDVELCNAGLVPKRWAE